MSAAVRRTVFTGLGGLSPVGSDPDTFFAALKEHKSGSCRLSFADPSALVCQIGGELPEFQPKKVVTNKEHQKAFRMMARTVQMGLVAATAGFRHAGLEVGKIDAHRARGGFGAGAVWSVRDG